MEILKATLCKVWDNNSDMCWMKLAHFMSRIQSRIATTHPSRKTMKSVCNAYRDVETDENEALARRTGTRHRAFFQMTQRG